MFRSKKTTKNASALEPDDIIDLAGEKYVVVENRQSEFSYTRRNLTLRPVTEITDKFGDQAYLLIPTYLPMTIHKK